MWSAPRGRPIRRSSATTTRNGARWSRMPVSSRSEPISLEYAGLIGPSGCGKSTLLMCIGGHLRPEHGQLFANGARIVGPGPDRVIVFQQTTLFPWLTVRGNVEYGLGLKAN